MVELHVRGEILEIELRGLHKLWALKSRLQVPLAAVVGARRLPPDAARSWWKGWRVPGTHLPGLLVAGTYYKGGEKHFWDVTHGDRSIEIELDGAGYDRLYLEVADPDAVLRQLEGPAQPEAG